MKRHLFLFAWLLGIISFMVAESGPLKDSSEEFLIRTSQSDTLNPQILLEVIEAQLDAIRKNDIPRAYSEFTSSEFRKITSETQFKQFVKNFSVLSANQSIKFNSVNFEKSIATLETTLISVNGEILDAEYDLVQENGKWKILGIQIFNLEITSLRPDQI